MWFICSLKKHNIENTCWTLKKDVEDGDRWEEGGGV